VDHVMSKYPGKAISGLNDLIIDNVMTAELCQLACLQQTTFTCRSVDYKPIQMICNLSKDNRTTIDMTTEWKSIKNVDYYEY
jgi:hypothetical protein